MQMLLDWLVILSEAWQITRNYGEIFRNLPIPAPAPAEKLTGFLSFDTKDATAQL